MGPLDFLWHIAGLLAPAAGVALLVSLSARLLQRDPAGRASWPVAFTLDFIAGTVAVVAGLWLFGRDAAMATYAAVVLACATSQWLLGRSWR